MIRFASFVAVWRWWYPLLWLCTMGLSVLGTFAVLQSPLYPAVRKLEARQVLTPETNYPDRISIYYAFIRNRNCATDQLRWLSRIVPFEGEETRNLLPIDSSTVPFADPAPGKLTEFIISYQIPPDLDPNVQWYFNSKSLNWCGPLSTIFGPSVSSTGEIPIVLPSQQP